MVKHCESYPKLKAEIDRLDVEKEKRVILITASGDSEQWVIDPIIKQYESLSGYLKWRDSGRVIAAGFYTRSDIEKSDFPRKAYELGKSLL